MDKMLINATQPEELRVAIVKNNTLYDLDIERTGAQKKKSNIYKAKITRIEPSLGAAFVDYGAKRQGFLPFKEVSPDYYHNSYNYSENRNSIADALKPGQELMVQVEKVERGSKGAALTTYISLAGCYLVLMPNNPKAGGISRRIEGDEREELKSILNGLDIPTDAGVIVRTAGLGKNLDSLQWDLSILLNQWQAIKDAFQKKPAPFLIHQDGDIVTRSIRDNLRKDIGEIIIDDPEIYVKAKNYIQQVRPDFTSKLKLYQDSIPLFTRYHIENQIETAHQREVILPSGGSIVIDKAEALISIDINSAKATSGGDIEETALNTNLEAAVEIARQLRIRDLGGLIVIDFIDMTQSKNQRAVENHLKEALKSDRARIQIGRISKFGLLEMSRQRLRPSLSEHSQIVCPKCDGLGTVRTIESLSLTTIRLLEEHTLNESISRVVIQLPVEIATFILNEKRHVITEIERRSKVDIFIIPNRHIEIPDYKIETFQQDIETPNQRTKPSYDLAFVPEVEASLKRDSFLKEDEPLIKSNFDIRQPKYTVSFFKKIWNYFFNTPNSNVRVEKKSSRQYVNSRQKSSSKYSRH